MINVEKASQPSAISVESRKNNGKTRKELLYSVVAQGSNRMQDEGPLTPTIVCLTPEFSERMRKDSQSSRKRMLNKINSSEKSSRKKKDEMRSTEKNGNKQELWSKVLGRRERKGNKIKEMALNKNGKVEPMQRKRKPLRTSAVVISVKDQNTSYAEVLAWARKSVALNDEEAKVLTTKRSATGGILLEIRGDKNKEISKRLASSLRMALSKYDNVKVHRPRQMAEATLVGLDVSITRDEIKMAIAKETSCSPEDITVGTIKTSPRGVGFA